MTNSGSNWTDAEWLLDVRQHYEDGYRFGFSDGKLAVAKELMLLIHGIAEEEKTEISLAELSVFATAVTALESDRDVD